MTREEFDKKWVNIRTTHSSECEWHQYELCTCGLRELERAKSLDKWQIEDEERKTAEKRVYTRSETKRRSRKIGFLALVGLLGLVMPPVAAIFLALWILAGSAVWLVEAYGPLYSNPHLRGAFGYLKFMFW